MDTIAVAPRPTSITPTPTDDVFSIGPDGKVYYQANSPYWEEGSPELVDPQPIAVLRIGAAWASDARALRLFALVLNPDLTTGDLYVNAMSPATWKFGGWDKVASNIKLTG